MCIHLNEGQTHPLELRVHQLENLLREAVAILSAKLRPDEFCALAGWLEETGAIINGE
jgi:hypothetical protein